jgi:hypothetical protein
MLEATLKCNLGDLDAQRKANVAGYGGWRIEELGLTGRKNPLVEMGFSPKKVS